MLAETIGIVAPVPSFVSSDTLSLLPTDERRGTRNTSEYVRS
jgi:hypothetical protein